jgi:drug/metabolite transporter (DMT)-like permease
MQGVTQTKTVRIVETAALTALAMVCFAANSVLCRMGLKGDAIDASRFTIIRLASGAAVLSLILLAARRRPSRTDGNWISAAMLFLYAMTFSFAYVSLAAGTGALILFGAVQLTMILGAMRSGERLSPPEWLGGFVAFGGLVVLTSPGLTAPSLLGSLLMAVAGISWGFYSLLGRGAANPLGDTAGNFVRTLPFLIVPIVFLAPGVHTSMKGVLLAVASGAVASGMGYAVWYSALRGLTATQAALVQLTAPVLAAAGGVVFLSEGVSLRLVISAVMVLGGVGLAVASHAGWVRIRFWE